MEYFEPKEILLDEDVPASVKEEMKHSFGFDENYVTKLSTDVGRAGFFFEGTGKAAHW